MPHVISEATVDDLLRRALEYIRLVGEPTSPTRGAALDATGVTLELTNPLARLSRTEGRGKVFSCLAEIFWYLGGESSPQMIGHYLPKYADDSEGGVIRGGYGPRLFGFDGFNQIQYVIDQLRANAWSRKAVVQIFDHEDVNPPHKSVPCTCALQFLIRGGALQLIAYMRSSDWHFGLPHDIFAFTMLQEMVARSIGRPLGNFVHMAGSLHLYERDREAANRFEREGWQTTTLQMPHMPVGDPQSSVQMVIEAERTLRTRLDAFSIDPTLPAYWADLVRLLAVFNYSKANRADEARRLGDEMIHSIYRLYVVDRLETR